MSDLEMRIMNLPCNVPPGINANPGDRIAYKLGHRDARHAAAELASAQINAPAGRGEVAESPEWIPVAKRKPEPGVMVLVWVNAQRFMEDDEGRVHEHDVSQCDFAHYVAPDGGFGDYMDHYSAGIGDTEWVSHWMPLPQPPKD